MSIILIALLLADPAPESRFDDLSEEQFCDVVRYAIGQAGPPGKPGQPVFQRSVSVECSAKKVTIEYQLMTMERPFRRWVSAYTREIQPKACSNSDPLMVSFRNRGWEQHYSFRSRARRTITHKIEC